MFFNLYTELLKLGVSIDDGQCSFTNTYSGDRSDDTIQSISSVINIQNLLFSSHGSNSELLKSLHLNNWKHLDSRNLVKAQLCLHSIVSHTVNQSKDLSQDESQIVSDVFKQVAESLNEIVENPASQQDFKELESVCNILVERGIAKAEDDQYQHIRNVAQHYLNISKAPQILFKITAAYIKTKISSLHPQIRKLRSAGSEISRLQSLVNVDALKVPCLPRRSSIPNVSTSTVHGLSNLGSTVCDEDINFKEVKDVVDLHAYKPRIKRPRRNQSENGKIVQQSKFAIIQAHCLGRCEIPNQLGDCQVSGDAEPEKKNKFIEISPIEITLNREVNELVQKSSHKTLDVVATNESVDSTTEKNEESEKNGQLPPPQEGWCAIV